MRKWKLASCVLSLGLVAGVAWAAWANAGPSAVTSTAAAAAAGSLPRPVARDGNATGMLAFSTTLAEDRQQITLIDPATRVMSVYHIEPKSGEIVLRAVRNVTWDMEMTVFNGTSPLPQEIRSQLQQR
jgi:hypothetical protein